MWKELGQASYHFEARPSLSNKRHMWLHKQDSGLLQARTAPTNHLTAATKRYPCALLPPRVRALHPRKAKAVMSKRAVMDGEPSEEAWSKLFSFCCTCLSINPSCPRMVQSSCIHLFLLLALEKSFSRCEVQTHACGHGRALMHKSWDKVTKISAWTETEDACAHRHIPRLKSILQHMPFQNIQEKSNQNPKSSLAQS